MSDLNLPPLLAVAHAFDRYGDEYFEAFEGLSVKARERILLAHIKKCEALLTLAEVDHRTAQGQRDAAFKVIQRIVKAEDFEDVREILQKSGWLDNE